MDCSNTTAEPHEYFDHTGSIENGIRDTQRGDGSGGSQKKWKLALVWTKRQGAAALVPASSPENVAVTQVGPIRSINRTQSVAVTVFGNPLPATV